MRNPLKVLGTTYCGNFISNESNEFEEPSIIKLEIYIELKIKLTNNAYRLDKQIYFLQFHF